MSFLTRRRSIDTIADFEPGTRLAPTLSWPQLIALGAGAGCLDLFVRLPVSTQVNFFIWNGLDLVPVFRLCAPQHVSRQERGAAGLIRPAWSRSREPSSAKRLAAAAHGDYAQS